MIAKHLPGQRRALAQVEQFQRPVLLIAQEQAYAADFGLTPAEIHHQVAHDGQRSVALETPGGRLHDLTHSR